MQVRYIAEHYTSTGRTIYTRQQLIAGDGDSYWGNPRPITQQTYDKAKRDGKHCEWIEHTKPLADIIQFDFILRHKRLREDWQNREGRWYR